MSAAVPFEAAAEAIDCEVQLVESVDAFTNKLLSTLDSNHAQTLEMLRLIGEHMVNGNAANASLLQVLAENTNAAEDSDSEAG